MIGSCDQTVKSRIPWQRSSPRRRTPKQAQRDFAVALAQELFEFSDLVFIGRKTRRTVFLQHDTATLALQTAGHPASDEILQTVVRDVRRVGDCRLPRVCTRYWAPLSDEFVNLCIQFECTPDQRMAAARRLGRIVAVHVRWWSATSIERPHRRASGRERAENPHVGCDRTGPSAWHLGR